MSGRVAVTGANGFIGRNVVLHLHNAGWAVRAIVRPGHGYAVPEGVEVVATQYVTSDLVRAAAGVEVLVRGAGRTRAATTRPFPTAQVEIPRPVPGAAVTRGAA